MTAAEDGRRLDVKLTRGILPVCVLQVTSLQAAAMAVMEALAVLAVLLALLYQWFRSIGALWPSLGVPCIKDGTIKTLRFMVMAEFRGYTQQRWYQHAKQQGHQFLGVQAGSMASLLAVHPDLVKTILVKDFAHFMDHGTYFSGTPFPN